MGKTSKTLAELDQLSATTQKRLLSEINEIADQLGQVAAGSFDFTVQVHSNDPIVQKLTAKVNLLLNTIHRTNSQVEEKNQTLSATAQTLQESDARFRFVVQSAHDAIVIADNDGKIISWNRGAQTIFGYTQAEVLGQSLTMLMPSRYRTAHQQGLARLNATGQPSLIGQTVEVYGLRKDGREFPLELSLATWQSGEGAFYGGIIRDITERKHLEQQLQESLARRSRQVQLSTQIAQDNAAATELTDLYPRVVTLIAKEFGYYHTQLLRYDPMAEEIVLVAGYGDVGAQMLAEDRRLPLGKGLIGLAAASGTSILRSDVSADRDWLSHPLLPHTQGELAVPIKLGGGDVKVQVTALETFIKHGFDGFAVIPIELEPIIPVVNKALAAGLRVVMPDDLGEGNQTARVWPVEYDMGYTLGVQAGQWAKAHLPPGESLKLGMLTYSQVIPAVKPREEGIIAGIKEVFGDNFEIVARETANDPPSGLPVAERWLRAHPDLKMIVGFNDGGALGAYRAVMAAGKDNPDVFFVGGIDAVNEALLAIKAGGAYQATVNIDPKKVGMLTVRTLVAAIAGQPYKRVNNVKGSPVNRSNIDQLLGAGSRVGPVIEEVTDEDNLAGLDLSHIKIGYSVQSLTNPYFAEMIEGAQAEATQLGVNLIVNDPKRVLGVLDVQSDVPGSLNAEDQLALEGLCAQIAAAIESKGLREEMEERLRELNALQRLMSREGWQAFHATQQQVVPGYLFDQTIVRPVTTADLWQHDNELAKPTALDASQTVTKPVAVRGEVIGALGVQSKPDQPLSLEDQAFLDAVAGQVAEALERARLIEQTQKRAVELEAVAKVSAVASSTLETQNLLQTVVDLTKTSFGLYHAHIYLLDETSTLEGEDQILSADSTQEKRILKLAAGAGEVGRQMVAQGWYIPLAHPHSLVAHAARTRQGTVVNNTRQHLNFLPNPLLPETRSEMAIPLLVGDKLLGVFDVQSDMINHFSETDLSVQNTLASQVAVALQNARLFDEQQQARFLLNERIKELNCLNDIGREIDETPPIPNFLQWVAERIPAATQHPHLCRVAIELDGQIYGSAEATSLPYQMAHGLRIGNEVVGRIYIAYTEKRDFINEESALLGGIARRVSGYIENRRLLVQTAEALTEVEVLYQINAQLSAATTLEEALQAAISPAMAAGANEANLFIFEFDTGGQPEWATLVTTWNVLEELKQPVSARFYLPDFALASLWLANPNELILVSDIVTDKRVDPEAQALYQQSGTLATVTLPLTLGKRWLGVISINWSAPETFSDNDKRLYQSIAAQAAVVINNLLLYEQAQQRAAQLEKLSLIETALSQTTLETEILTTIALVIDQGQEFTLTLSYMDTDEADQPIALYTVASWHDGVLQPDAPGLGQRYALNQIPISKLWLEASDEVLFIADTQKDLRLDEEMRISASELGLGALAIIPLRGRGRWQGLVQFHWTEPHLFTPNERFIMRRLLESLAAAVTSRRAYLAQQEALAETKNLYSVSSYISTANNLSEILNAIAEGVFIPAINRILLLTFERDGTDKVVALRVAANWHSLKGAPPMQVGTRYPQTMIATLNFLYTTETLFFEDVQQDARVDSAMLMILEELAIKAMAVLPLWSGSTQVGVLLFEAEEAYHFSESERRSYLSVVGQAAVAIENQRLLAETRAALAEVEATQRRYTVQAWETYRVKNKVLSHEQVREGVIPLGENLLPEISKTIAQEQPPTADELQTVDRRPQSTNGGLSLAVGGQLLIPLNVRGETIGVLGLQETDESREWSPEEITLIEAIAEQLAQAAENIRLIDETQQRAAREKRVNEISEKIQSAQSLEEALQIAVKEVGLSLQAPQTTVQLEVK